MAAPHHPDTTFVASVVSDSLDHFAHPCFSLLITISPEKEAKEERVERLEAKTAKAVKLEASLVERQAVRAEVAGEEPA